MSSEATINAPAPKPRRVAIAIGVGDAEKLPFLAGARNAALGFHAWALASGYESTLVTDEDEPVTFPRLKAEFDALLAPGLATIHRLLIYFAGHGVIVEAEQGLWLLSQWRSEQRAVAYEALKRRLTRYGIEQIGIFADACRTLPSDIETADLTPDAVLGLGPRQKNDPALDKFVAAQDGTATFAIPGASEQDDRCLFSGVLLEGLWGTKKAAFSKIEPGKITSRSLSTYVKTEVSALATTYGRKVEPAAIHAFPEGDDYYYDSNGPALSPPAFAPWPPALKSKDAPRAATRGGEEPPPMMTVGERMERFSAPTHFETGAGFAIEGVDVTALWTPPGTLAEVQGESHWWRIGHRDCYSLRHPVPVLIELTNDRYVATTALPDFIASLLCDRRGASALVYREVWSDRTQAGKSAEVALDRMERGALRASAVIDEAVNLRQGKHVDPVLGAVSAYLYESIGDVDSIRHMAWAYQWHNQAIPYDIALLAQLEVTGFADDLLQVVIPAVPARAPRTDKEEKFAWTHAETAAAVGVVAGFWPLLRQGWTFLDDSALVIPGLVELTTHLMPARFTTLDREGAQQLAALLHLERRAR